MKWANAVFLVGCLSFLTGVALIDYRWAMVAGGLGAMTFAALLARVLARTHPNGEGER